MKTWCPRYDLKVNLQVTFHGYSLADIVEDSHAEFFINLIKQKLASNADLIIFDTTEHNYQEIAEQLMDGFKTSHPY